MGKFSFFLLFGGVWLVGGWLEWVEEDVENQRGLRFFDGARWEAMGLCFLPDRLAKFDWLILLVGSAIGCSSFCCFQNTTLSRSD